MSKNLQISDPEEDLTLKLWDGDDSAKGELLVACEGTIERAMRRAFPALSAEDAEDVVCEAIRRFWLWREKFDPTKSSIRSRLYWFAEKVAMEYRAGKLKRHRAQLIENAVDPEFFSQIEAVEIATEPPDDVLPTPSPIQKALAACFRALPELQRDILQAYGDAGPYQLDASRLGKELGNYYKGGVPIPAGTIRTYRSRAWDNLESCMRKKNFDLEKLGYFND